MQAYTFVFILGAAALSAAQNITGLGEAVPVCAVGCLIDAAAASGCGITDYACQCANYAAIQASSTVCLNSRCAAADIAGMCHPAC